MVVGKNKGLNKAGKKGGKKKMYVGYLYSNLRRLLGHIEVFWHPIKSDLIKSRHQNFIKKIFYY